MMEPDLCLFAARLPSRSNCSTLMSFLFILGEAAPIPLLFESVPQLPLFFMMDSGIMLPLRRTFSWKVSFLASTPRGRSSPLSARYFSRALLVSNCGHEHHASQ